MNIPELMLIRSHSNCFVFNFNLNTVFIFCQPKAQCSMLTLRPNSFFEDLELNHQIQPKKAIKSKRLVDLKNASQKGLSTLKIQPCHVPRIKFLCTNESERGEWLSKVELR